MDPRARLLVLASAALLAAAPVAAEPTPSWGTLGPESTSVTWTGGDIAAASPATNDDSCVENVNCETFTLTLLSGNYDASNLAIELDGPDEYWIVVREGDEIVATGSLGVHALHADPLPAARLLQARER